MSPEQFDEHLLTDHKDSVLYMMLRRLINGQYAEQPVDFNLEGLKAGERLFERSFTSADLLIDIGSSSGEMIAEAAQALGTQARIMCIEPDQEAFDAHLRLSDEHRQRISFLQATGEAVPLKDSSAQGATLHNVIFRAADSTAMLSEAKRVVEPGGFIAISSNAKGHAYYRHQFERNVAEIVMNISDVKFAIPAPPAEGYYLEDLPALIKKVGGLAIREDLHVSQDTQAVITRGRRLENYLDSIKYSAANTDLPPERRAMWRQVVDFWAKPFIEAEIKKAETVYREAGITTEPFFADSIYRGMFVLQNEKST